MNKRTEISETLPDSLISALRAADQAPAVIASRVDRAVAVASSEQFSARAERPSSRRSWYAVAASVLAVALVLQLQVLREPDELLFTDVDGSGQIDIADVMVLAMRDDHDYTAAELDAFAHSVVAVEDRL